MDNSKSIDEYLVEAGALHGQGRLREARELLEQAREIEPTRPEVHFNLGLCLAGEGDTAGAIASFQEAVRCRPDWADAHVYLVAYTLQAGEVGRALELLAEAFRIAPDNAALRGQFAIATQRSLALQREPGDEHFNRGLLLGAEGDAAGAAASFQEAVRCRPDWADAHVYLVAYTLQAGDVGRALELLDEALKIAPDNASLHEQFAIATERNIALQRERGKAADVGEATGYVESALGYLKSIDGAAAAPGDAEGIRRYVETLSRVRGALELAEASLAREHGMAFNRARSAGADRAFPGFIVLSTMPKSGSEFVWLALSTGLNLKPTRISSAQMFEVIDGERLDTVAKGGFVTHGHMHCSVTNSVLLSQHVDRLVVHVRDPRQALVSWVHYQDHPDIRDYPTRSAWGNVADMSFEARVDYFIDGFFAHQVNFLQSWLDAQSDPEFRPRMLVTRQEDLRAAPTEFFTRILDFYDLDPGLFRYPEPPKEGKQHFRRGETDEWRTVLLPAQIERMQAMLPDALLERYGWKR